MSPTKPQRSGLTTEKVYILTICKWWNFGFWNTAQWMGALQTVAIRIQSVAMPYFDEQASGWVCLTETMRNHCQQFHLIRWIRANLRFYWNIYHLITRILILSQCPSFGRTLRTAKLVVFRLVSFQNLLIDFYRELKMCFRTQSCQEQSKGKQSAVAKRLGHKICRPGGIIWLRRDQKVKEFNCLFPWQDSLHRIAPWPP